MSALLSIALHVYTVVAEQESTESISGGANEIVLLASALPSGREFHKPPLISVISGKPIKVQRSAWLIDVEIIFFFVYQGPAVALDAARSMFVTRTEAVQWACVNPFSPLCDGTRWAPL